MVKGQQFFNAGARIRYNIELLNRVLEHKSLSR